MSERHERVSPEDRPPRYIPLTKWGEHHVYPPMGKLRWLVAHAEETNFDRVILRCGRRILLDESAFFDWLRTQDKDDRT